MSALAYINLICLIELMGTSKAVIIGDLKVVDRGKNQNEKVKSDF